MYPLVMKRHDLKVVGAAVLYQSTEPEMLQRLRETSGQSLTCQVVCSLYNHVDVLLADLPQDIFMDPSHISKYGARLTNLAIAAGCTTSASDPQEAALSTGFATLRELRLDWRPPGVSPDLSSIPHPRSCSQAQSVATVLRGLSEADKQGTFLCVTNLCMMF